MKPSVDGCVWCKCLSSELTICYRGNSGDLAAERPNKKRLPFNATLSRRNFKLIKFRRQITLKAGNSDNRRVRLNK